MKLRIVGPNQTEVTIGEVTAFFSYDTLVAAHIGGDGFYRTAQSYSKTTSRHINQWVGDANTRGVAQARLEAIVQAALSNGGITQPAAIETAKREGK